MRIAILSREPKNYSTKRLLEAAKLRGHEVDLIDTLACYMNITSAKPAIFYYGKKLHGYDAIIPRIGASITFYGTAVVRQFEMMGVYSLNESVAITRARDKLRSMQLLSRKGVGLPVTGFARDAKDVSELIKMVGGAPLVIKLLEGTQGKGVMLSDTEKSAHSIVQAFFGQGINIMIQEYIKESGGADIRCFVIDGKVVASIKRQAKDGEFRSNLHLGGYAEQIKITPQERATAIQAAKIIGLNVCGVDILRSKRGPLVVEVNSSPGLEGIEKATKIDIGDIIIQTLEHKVKASKSKRNPTKTISEEI